MFEEKAYRLPAEVYNFFKTQEKSVFNESIRQIHSLTQDKTLLKRAVTRWIEEDKRLMPLYQAEKSTVTVHKIPPYTNEQITAYVNALLAMLLAGYDFMNLDDLSVDHWNLLENIALAIILLRSELTLKGSVNTPQIDDFLIKVMLTCQTGIAKFEQQGIIGLSMSQMKRLAGMCFEAVKKEISMNYHELLATQYQQYAHLSTRSCLKNRLKQLAQQYAEINPQTLPLLKESEHELLIPESSAHTHPFFFFSAQDLRRRYIRSGKQQTASSSVESSQPSAHQHRINMCSKTDLDQAVDRSCSFEATIPNEMSVNG